MQSKGLSRVFSNTTVQKHQFFSTQLFYSPTLTSIHDYWKNRSLDCCCCEVASVESNSVRPHRRQPTRPRRPWDSPGKNTGVGCHFLLQCMKVKRESEVAQSSPTLSDPMDCSLQAPPSMGFSRQEYWSGVPLPSPLWNSNAVKIVENF